jgi:hypothetical protein
MNITTKLYKQVSEPPAHVAQLLDSGVMLIANSYGHIEEAGLVLKLKHSETNDTFNQLFLLSQSQMQQLADQLRLFADAWEGSHESEQGGA